MSLKYLGKTMAFILRHHPEDYGITLDEHGWAKVDELIAAIAKEQKFNREMLEEIVATDNKQRYSFNEDKTLIRANQGHSIPIDVETAVKVGSKHGKPEIFRVRTGAMAEDGYEFFLSVNGVWLTKEVPVKYLKLIKSE